MTKRKQYKPDFRGVAHYRRSNIMQRNISVKGLPRAAILKLEKRNQN